MGGLNRPSPPPAAAATATPAIPNIDLSFLNVGPPGTVTPGGVTPGGPPGTGAAAPTAAQRAAAIRNMVANQNIDVTSRANTQARSVLPPADTQRVAAIRNMVADQNIDVTSRANTQARRVLPSADEQRSAIAAGGTAYSPEVTGRIEQIDRNQEVLDWLATPDAQAFLGITSPAPAAPTVTAPAPAPTVAAPAAVSHVVPTTETIEQQYTDMFADLTDDAELAFDTSTQFLGDQGLAVDDYFEDRSGAATDYYGSGLTAATDFLDARDLRESGQLQSMADLRTTNWGNQYQQMLDALDAEQLRRSGRLNELETSRGGRLDSDEAELMALLERLEGDRLGVEGAMQSAMQNRYRGAQEGLDARRAAADAELRAAGIDPAAYTSGVGAETAALLGSQGMSSMDLQDRLAGVTGSEALDRSLAATGLFQDARSSLADELFGARGALDESVAGRRDAYGLQNQQMLGAISEGLMGGQHGLANEIAGQRFGAQQQHDTGMFQSGEGIAQQRFDAEQGLAQQQHQAEQTYNAEISRIDEMEASGQISRAEAAQAKAEAETKAAAERQREASQFAQIDTQMGLAPGTAQAMSAGGLLGDLYADLMAEPEADPNANLMPWVPQGGDPSNPYMVDPEIAFRAELGAQADAPVAMWPFEMMGPDGQPVIVNVPVQGPSDIGKMQENVARG